MFLVINFFISFSILERDFYVIYVLKENLSTLTSMLLYFVEFFKLNNFFSYFFSSFFNTENNIWYNCARFSIFKGKFTIRKYQYRKIFFYGNSITRTIFATCSRLCVSLKISRNVFHY